MSYHCYTMRGLHCQAPPSPQGKLVTCLAGRILDVAVDARVGSETYGQHVLVELSPEDGALFFVPRGFLHGYLTLEPDTQVRLFGKPAVDGERRMGVALALGDSIAAARASATAAANAITPQFG